MGEIKELLVIYINKIVPIDTINKMIATLHEDYRIIVVAHEGDTKIDLFKPKEKISNEEFDKLFVNVGDFQNQISKYFEEIKPIEIK